MKLLSILLSLINPSKSIVIFKKIIRKVFPRRYINTQLANIEWLHSNESSFSKLAKQINGKLWEESKHVSNEIQDHANDILSSQNVKMGGGGMHPFLYFLTRVLNPENVLETGVASGYSSLSFLLAMDKNQKGRLFSSDFPYFRNKNPEMYIGVLVHDYLKSRWSLRIDGDEKNLNKFFKETDSFDIAHYDSDKSYEGRSFFMSSIASKMTKDSIILMDDIQDNPFFMDYVLSNNIENWNVFKFEGKYIGMIGSIK